jgi:hypothetical protein
VLNRLRGQAETDRGDARHDASRRGCRPFSDAELERYARHITLPDIGGGGQLALKQAKVLVVGAGGLGRPRFCIWRRRGWGGSASSTATPWRCRTCSGR